MTPANNTKPNTETFEQVFQFSRSTPTQESPSGSSSTDSLETRTKKVAFSTFSKIPSTTYKEDIKPEFWQSQAEEYFSRSDQETEIENYMNKHRLPYDMAKFHLYQPEGLGQNSDFYESIINNFI